MHNCTIDDDGYCEECGAVWECGEIFYGYAPPWQISGVDFSVPRVCDLPLGHDGKHWYKEDPPRPEIRRSRRWYAKQERGKKGN